eukprot:Protomagalhaensia_sp_Gyna_25__6034@NODE_952_length_2358_cov_115_015524_g757_i0_p2_GENE_NODE_952_length_2358_cov_115_015524_g757_i0NODE_952_length_2358_cov_115_015524_g757_i0_p2_ORF_typecomplete_len244_score26_75_NODE_952_length_2358_cov_115_015524_g757_i010541785
MPLPQEGYQFARNAGGYTPVWDPSPRCSFGSVNAGDPGLYVGGGGVNGAFGASLKYHTSFQQLHEHALNIARSDTGSSDGTCLTSRFLCVPDASTLCKSVSKCYVRVIPELMSDSPTGICIIHLLDPQHRPLHVNNAAMVYVVGPRGKHGPASDFLTQVKLTAKNMLAAVNEFNRLNPQDALKLLRVCLISGGIFRHKKVSKDQVAQAVIAGLADTWDASHSPKLDFAWDQSAFQNAMHQNTL